jgi:hypothetical protein
MQVPVGLSPSTSMPSRENVRSHEGAWRGCVHELSWGGLHWQLFYDFPKDLNLIWNCILGFNANNEPSWHLTVSHGDQPFLSRHGLHVQMAADGITIDEFIKVLKEAYWKHAHPENIPIVDDMWLCEKCWYRYHAVALADMKKTLARYYDETEEAATLGLAGRDEFREFSSMFNNGKHRDVAVAREKASDGQQMGTYQQLVELLAEDPRLATLHN